MKKSLPGLLAITPSCASASAEIGSGAGLLVFDPIANRAYVADRAHDRIVVVDVASEALAIATSWPTPVEPLGVAAGAPYLHDGSAPTLEAVLLEQGSIHGMVERTFTPEERADLIAFLESL